MKQFADKKILSPQEITEVTQHLQNQDKRIVLAGGCFDLLHIGHVQFLQKAKDQGDILFIILEHDVSVAKRKGSTRPIYSQADRAAMLAALAVVDYVILLPDIMTDADYDRLVLQVKPAIIATTKSDPTRNHKERQAKKMNARVIDVIDRIGNQSTSKLAAIVAKEFNL
jgi:FAD synthetase